MSSIEWSDAQLRILIDERKQRNAEYHKKKRLFWEDIANKINEQENTNYFIGDVLFDGIIDAIAGAIERGELEEEFKKSDEGCIVHLNDARKKIDGINDNIKENILL